VRVPKVLLKCKLATAAAVITMVIGTCHDSPGLRSWGVLFGILAATLAVVGVIQRCTEALKAYIHRWAHETFEHGMRQGIEMGREIEAAERFIQSTREHP
jgi:hypothetical protein